MTSTVRAASSPLVKPSDGSSASQMKKLAMEIAIIAGTKNEDTLSTVFWIGDLLSCASLTSLMMRDNAVPVGNWLTPTRIIQI